MDKQLTENLAFLRMPHLKDEIISLAETAARKKISHLDFFAQAIAAEVAQKRARAIDRKITQAHFPQRKTLESFDWTHPTKINQQLIRFLFNLKFVAEHKNIAFLGLPGLGKTHLLIALGLHACEHGYTVLYETAANIVNRLHAAQMSGTLISVLRTYTRVDILCIDEIGFLPIDQDGANLLFQIISSRYETGSIILTSNKAFKEWGSIFKDAAITSAVLDRLLHHCEVITIEGKSYRMQNRKKK